MAWTGPPLRPLTALKPKLLLPPAVVPVPALSTDLTDGQVLPTLLPKASLTVSVSPKGVKVSNAAAKGAGAPPAAKVLVPNIKAGKSVIHVIDRVLLPEVPSTRQMAEAP